MNLFINDQEAPPAHKDFLLSFHGRSVFTTFRSRSSELLGWPLHWQRLKEHASFFGYSLPDEKVILRRMKQETLSGDRKFRVLISDQLYAITSEEYETPPSFIYQGVKAHQSFITTHPILGLFKTGNSLPYSLAHQEAKKVGAFEALLCDQDGYLVDGSRTSLLMIKDQTIFSLSGGLSGTMREQAIKWAQTLGIKCENIRLKPHEIDGDLLLSNSLMGIVPVGKATCEISHALVEQFRMG